MNPIIQEIETRLEVCCRQNRAAELAALKVAVERLGELEDETDTKQDGHISDRISATLTKIAKLLGVKETG